MLYYRYRLCDRRRWTRARDALRKEGPLAASLLEAAHTGDDAARLALADLAEETGHAYCAVFLRTNLTCVQPARSLRDRRSVRRAPRLA